MKNNKKNKMLSFQKTMFSNYFLVIAIEILIIMLAINPLVNTIIVRNQINVMQGIINVMKNEQVADFDVEKIRAAVSSEGSAFVTFSKEDGTVLYHVNATIDKGYQLSEDNLKDLTLMFSGTKGTSQGKYFYNSKTAESVESIVFPLTSRNNQINLIVDHGEYFSLLQSPLSSANKVANVAYVVVIFVGFSTVYFVLSLTTAEDRKMKRILSEFRKVISSVDGENVPLKYDLRSFDEFDEIGDKLNFMIDSVEENKKILEENNIVLANDLERRVKLDKATSEFISNTSHELNTPLTIISSTAQFMKEDTDGSDDKIEDIEIILNETDRMQKILKQLIEFVRLEKNTVINRKETFSLSDLTNSILKSFKNYNKEGYTFDVSVEEGLEIYGNRIDIEKAIMNYVTNAIKYSNDKYINVKLYSISNDIWLSVYNNGSQIEESEMELIWDKFYRTDKSRTRNIQGDLSIGIGLSIVAEVSKNNQMQYGVKNKDKGVEFYLMFKKSK